MEYQSHMAIGVFAYEGLTSLSQSRADNLTSRCIQSDDHQHQETCIFFKQSVEFFFAFNPGPNIFSRP